MHALFSGSIADDPLRAVCWRWDWANGFNKLYPQQPTVEDAWMLRAKRFLDAVAAAGYPSTRRRHRNVDADLERVLAIRFEHEPRHRALLESHLLIGETTAAVAARCGLTAEVVECYEQLLYDVRGRLDDHRYIMAKAIEVYRPEDYAREHPFKLWRAIAYKGGVAMLETFLAGTEGSILPTPPEVPEEQAASWWPAQKIACRSLIESLLSPDAFEPSLLDQLRRHARQAAERRRAGTPDTDAQRRTAVRKIVAEHEHRLAEWQALKPVLICRARLRD